MASSKRTLIIDVSHLFYRYAYGGASSLSAMINVDGRPTQVDTTLPNYVIKTIHRWSEGGFHDVVVCFDGYGSTKSRKAYFAVNTGFTGSEPVGYKGGRENQNDSFYQGVNITMNLLANGGVVCLKADGYEADDLVKAAIDRAKEQHPDRPIDVITGDVDLVPLVDEQVSVFLYSVKSTWAESKELEKKHYYQLKPDNYEAYISGLTAFKKLLMPYNTVLLAKLLRGDKSDGISGYPKFTPTKFNKLITALQEDGVDLGNLFRYDAPLAVISYRDTEEPIPEDLIESTPREQKMIKFHEPPALTRMCEVLSNYLDEDIIRHIRYIYNGINLNGAFVGLGDKFNRRPAQLTVDIKGYNAGELQKVVSEVKIRLPIF